MESKFWHAYVNYYTITVDVLLLIGIYFFLKLPKEKKANSLYWLPLVILGFSVIYEALGGYVNSNFEFKKAVNEFLGNTENPMYNIWLYNISNKQITTVLFLFLIKIWIEPSKKKYINWMISIFLITAVVFQLTGVEPLYLDQPFIAALAANIVLVSCGLYFIGMITNDHYLDSHPLRLISFWQTTILLFTYSLIYINSVARIYIFGISRELAINMANIDRVLGISVRAMLLLIIISPFLNKVFDREPFYVPSRKSDLIS
ncbi:histidine kinase [Algoriphagus winogradskyi]|uniref:Uncharacterized protein n=1 Tax=Algoriphagus winogradskyi TaxID=237017 RepID=A0ABY1NPW8_9BACT|nr:histidine kinase [Algoriphagus winogradskyi]SMP14696.1 hypothetical protein SAMN06265367_102376 [Algoriphagus winogradskyi]